MDCNHGPQKPPTLSPKLLSFFSFSSPDLYFSLFAGVERAIPNSPRLHSHNGHDFRSVRSWFAEHYWTVRLNQAEQYRNVRSVPAEQSWNVRLVSIRTNNSDMFGRNRSNSTGLFGLIQPNLSLLPTNPWTVIAVHGGSPSLPLSHLHLQPAPTPNSWTAIAVHGGLSQPVDRNHGPRVGEKGWGLPSTAIAVHELGGGGKERGRGRRRGRRWSEGGSWGGRGKGGPPCTAIAVHGLEGGVGKEREREKGGV